MTEAAVPVPSPEHVAALVALGWESGNPLPLWAAYWVAADLGGEVVLAIACLSESQAEEARELLPAALAELGVTIPAVSEAARRVLNRYSDELLRGELESEDVRGLVWSLFCGTDYNDDVAQQPLAMAVLENDYLEGEWFATLVRRGAQAQLGLPLEPLPRTPAQERHDKLQLAVRRLRGAVAEYIVTRRKHH